MCHVSRYPDTDAPGPDRVAESTVSAPDAPAPQIDLTRAAQPYDAVPIQAPLGDRESFYEPGAVTVAQLWLGQILEREAPVLRERMLRRLADAFGEGARSAAASEPACPSTRSALGTVHGIWTR
jgi:hypothetical protein